MAMSALEATLAEGKGVGAGSDPTYHMAGSRRGRNDSLKGLKQSRSVAKTSVEELDLALAHIGDDLIGSVASVDEEGGDMMATTRRLKKTGREKATIGEKLPPNEGLLLAAIEGDVASVARHIARGAFPEISDKDGNSALHFAARFGFAPVVAALLQLGIDSSPLNNFYLSPLHFAAMEGHFEVVKLLLSYRADPNLRSRVGWGALHLALRHQLNDVAKLLLFQGADPDLPGEDDVTPLHVATATGNTEMGIFLVVRAKAEINVKTGAKGITPLMFAAMKGNVTLTRMLMQAGAEGNTWDSSGRTALHYAAARSQRQCGLFLVRVDVLTPKEEDEKRAIFEKWALLTPSAEKRRLFRTRRVCRVDIRADDGQTPVHLVALLGNVDFVRLLLDCCPCVDIRAERNHRTIGVRMKKGRLLAEELSPFVSLQCSGWTPLHSACYRGQTAVVELLLVRNASPNLQDDNGNTPLLFAVSFLCDLIEHGVHEARRRRSSIGAMDIMEKQRARERRSGLGEGVLAVNQAHTLEESFGFQKKDRLAIAAPHDEHHTDVDLKKETSSTSVLLKCLLENGADPNLGNNMGLVPLHLACQKGKTAIAKVLIEGGADILAVDGKGWNGLHHAASRGSVSLVKLLLQHCQPSSVFKKTDQGLTPAQIAKANARLDLYEEFAVVEELQLVKAEKLLNQ
mmetsp:Transcript_49717/g.127880  ORF Transcript_49717/g.127880 Transcript_49717/m.127880 type:complete len:684 (-) Transcript_49717:389-2440(-)